MKSVKLNKNISFGPKSPFVFIAGPCVIESASMTRRIAAKLVEVTRKLKVPFVFKASFDKANRTSVKSFRGPGLQEGLKTLYDIKNEFDVPVTSDIHETSQVEVAAQVLDILQIPAFLSRQTDLLIAAAQSGKIVNVKKGQFLAPWDMKAVVDKVNSVKGSKLLLTERGTSFGYNTLVTDFRSLPTMQDLGAPVVFDATHSVQQPGGKGTSSGGQSQFVPLLARCAVAAGVNGLFVETHPNPAKALSDGPNMIKLSEIEKFLKGLITIDRAVKK